MKNSMRTWHTIRSSMAVWMADYEDPSLLIESYNIRDGMKLSEYRKMAGVVEVEANKALLADAYEIISEMHDKLEESKEE